MKRFLMKLFNYINNKKNQIRYNIWIKKNEPNKKELLAQKTYSFQYNPKISIIVPMYNPPKEYILQLIDSIEKQTYKNWELCIADGSDMEEKYLQRIRNNNRIKYIFLKQNKGISANTNEAIKLATGDYYAFLDHDDIIPEFSLFEIVKTINDNIDVDFIYTDEDKIYKNKRIEPFFKPDFAIDTLLSYNYICHFTIIKKELLNRIEKFRSEFDGAQDYDLILRATQKAEKIIHIPKILYHWRINEKSVSFDSNSKPYAYSAGKKAIQSYLQSEGIEDVDIEENKKYKGIYNTNYLVKEQPLVSIIVYSKRKDNLNRILQSITKLKYKNLEIIINTKEINNSFMENLNIIEVMNQKKNSYYEYTFLSVMKAKGEFVLFINDCEIISNNCIEKMLGYFQRQEIGIVGSKILKCNGKIYHNGIIIDNNKIEYTNKNLKEDYPGYVCNNIINKNCTATTKVLMIRKSDLLSFFNNINKKIENDLYYDISLCLRIISNNKLIVNDSSIKSIFLGKDEKKNDIFCLCDKNNSFIIDRYFNKNLLSKNGKILIKNRRIK
ncbi:MAG: glycosyltransferase [Clostridia bacterium]|nr:glycosyltransferase [Clostridia bacterium]